MKADNFPDVLVRASKAVGSLLGVAKLLGVEPLQVYHWIASVEEPSAAQRREFVRRLLSIMADGEAATGLRRQKT